MTTLRTHTLALALSGLIGSLALTACELEVPDLNNPALDQLENNPTAASISAACTGLLIGNRVNLAPQNGYVGQLGILGREAYSFDSADPRYTSELLQGSLSRSSPFGGAFWGAPYANIRLANIILKGVDKVADFTGEEKSAIQGFAHTMQALAFLQIINAHDTNGAVIDTDRPLGAELAPIAEKPEVQAEIARLLDVGATELGAGGDEFPFPLEVGFSGFDAPPSFLTFNRAIRARVAAYTEDYAGVLTALTDSFIDDEGEIDFRAGVYHSYSTKSGDITNGLQNVNLFAHPSLLAEVQKNGTENDARYTAKLKTVPARGAAPTVSTLQFTMYAATTPVPIIRNEELILLKAEALFFTGMVGPAMTELNLVREGSGELTALLGEPSRETFIDYLLYERKYSLMFEGGHRWLDLRRFGREIPLDTADHSRNVRYPIPLAECDARPGEAKCILGST
ncbi:MAG: RagB/SusD family nutrient uptake outer membrane protein [Myxococcales bacterium]|nr:RagB/SusD family nutrient uptake outer membrane protein [Myxococcales bacterium]